MVFAKRENELFVTLSTKPKQPKWSFASRHPAKDHRAGLPGPGSYNPPPLAAGGRLRSAPAVSMSWRTSDARGLKGRDSPGPGAYSVPSTIRPNSAMGTASSFGSAPRGNRLRHDVPPPGTYDVAPAMGKEGPKISIRGKPRELNSGRGPGSGSNVGPGAYYNDAFLGRRRGYTFGVGHGDWKTKKASDNVGPGSYNLPDTFGHGPGVTIKSRFPVKSSGVDAPVLGPWTQFGY